MPLSPGYRRRAVVLFALAAAAACGSRSDLEDGPPATLCHAASDCPGFEDKCQRVVCAEKDDPTFSPARGPAPGVCVVVEATTCDDHDPCTLDACDPSTGACAHPHATPDGDGDGFYAPLPGHLPGDPGACGDDCDDTDPAVHPGAAEVCDGVDNDCNGIVDDGAAFVSLDGSAERISGDVAPVSPGGLAFSGSTYAALYTGQTTAGFQIFSQRLSPDGSVASPEAPFVLVNADAQGGPIVWSGDRYGAAWSDRRTGSYEIYFAALQESGAKIAPGDVRLSASFDYALNPSLVWTGAEFVVAWQDNRGGAFSVLAQRLDRAGAPIGGNVALSDAAAQPGFTDESPTLAQGLSTLGVAWGHTGMRSHVIDLSIVPPDLGAPAAPLVELTTGETEAVYPIIVWNRDRYVVAWYDRTANPRAIYAAAVDEQGNVLVPARPITSPGAFTSRYPALRPLGDRLLLVYSDDRDGNDGFELYSRLVTPGLDPIGGETRLTSARGDSIEPAVAFGPQGNLGILFRDDREGQHDLYFTRLGCAAP